ncbi:hypothetical protein D3C80_578330 [compost metagenome]
MAGDMAQISALRQLAFNVRIQRFDNRYAVHNFALAAKQFTVDPRQNARVLVGFAPHHHAIQMLQMLFRLFQRFHPPVNRQSERREIPF